MKEDDVTVTVCSTDDVMKQRHGHGIEEAFLGVGEGEEEHGPEALINGLCVDGAQDLVDRVDDPPH